MRVFPLPPLFVLVIVLSGCTQSPTSTPSVNPAATPEETNPNAFTLTIIKTVYDDNDETDGSQMQTIASPTADTIRKQFAGLDWDNPLHSNSIGLNRGVVNAPGYISLSIAGTLKPRNADEQMKAHWSELPGGQTVWKHMSYGPIVSKQQAIDLLISFLAQDDNYRTSVAWSE